VVRGRDIEGGAQLLIDSDPNSKSNKNRITPSFMTKYERARIIGNKKN